MAIPEMKNNDYTKELNKVSKNMLVSLLNEVYKIIDNRDWSDDTTNVGEIIIASGYCDFEK